MVSMHPYQKTAIAHRFIALPVACGDWYSRLSAASPRGIRLVEPADLHVTLLFLGHCDPAPALAALQAVRRLQPPLPRQLRLGTAAVFGSALGFDLEGAEGLTAWLLQHRATLLAQAGVAADPRPPRPHLTVARRRGAGPLATLDWLAPLIGSRIELAQPMLYESAPPGVRPRYRQSTG